MQISNQLPAYSQRSSRWSLGTIPASFVENFEHKFPMERNGRVWLTLNVRSRAKSANTPPIYTEGDTVSGHVELKFDRPEKIKEITVTVRFATSDVARLRRNPITDARRDNSGRTGRNTVLECFTINLVSRSQARQGWREARRKTYVAIQVRTPEGGDNVVGEE